MGDEIQCPCPERTYPWSLPEDMDNIKKSFPEGAFDLATMRSCSFVLLPIALQNLLLFCFRSFESFLSIHSIFDSIYEVRVRAVADLTVGGLGGRLGPRRCRGPVDRHSIVCRMDRVLATRAPGMMADGAPRLAKHLHPLNMAHHNGVNMY